MKLDDQPKENIYAAVHFANGLRVVNPETTYVQAARRIEHGDWKTQSVRKEFMGLFENEIGILENRWLNFYGLWYRVRRADGQCVDCHAKDLNLLTEAEYNELKSKAENG